MFAKKKKFCITDLTVVYNNEFYPAYILFPPCTWETLFIEKKSLCICQNNKQELWCILYV